MRFTKMEGCGNDYIYIDVTKEALRDPKAFAVKYSDRHFGIGGDGLITIGLSERADFFMHIYNADGSEAMMCGNGIRCVAKYVYDKGLTDKKVINIDTLSGVKTVHIETEGGKVKTARVDMGKPTLSASEIPVMYPQGSAVLNDQVIEQPICVGGREWTMTCVSVGNPHAVVWCDDPDSVEIEKIGPAFENNPIFPERANTEFIHVIDDRNIKMRVWERGSAETIACGTGATASAYACMVTGKCGDKVTVHLRGGDLLIEYDQKTGHLYMTGPAKISFEGECEW